MLCRRSAGTGNEDNRILVVRVRWPRAVRLKCFPRMFASTFPVVGPCHDEDFNILPLPAHCAVRACSFPSGGVIGVEDPSQPVVCIGRSRLVESVGRGTWSAGFKGAPGTLGLIAVQAVFGPAGSRPDGGMRIRWKRCSFRRDAATPQVGQLVAGSASTMSRRLSVSRLTDMTR